MGPHLFKGPALWGGGAFYNVPTMFVGAQLLLSEPELCRAPRTSVAVGGQMLPEASPAVWQRVIRSWDSGDAQVFCLAAFLTLIGKGGFGLYHSSSPCKSACSWARFPTPSISRRSAPPLVAALRSWYPVQANTKEGSGDTASA